MFMQGFPVLLPVCGDWREWPLWAPGLPWVVALPRPIQTGTRSSALPVLRATLPEMASHPCFAEGMFQQVSSEQESNPGQESFLFPDSRTAPGCEFSTYDGGK